MTAAHESAEEKLLFPALEERYRHVADAYEFDHDHFGESFFGGMRSALDSLSSTGSNSRRKEDSATLYRSAIALNESMRLHVTKENELLVPIIANEFDTDEQIRIAGALAGTFDPALMAETTAWMYKGQDKSDRELMIRFFLNALPPEPLGKTIKMLSAIGSPADWKEMESRIPELSGR